jgi:folate-dependent phosphoribosylglycinamide formyltransferase PurN
MRWITLSSFTGTEVDVLTSRMSFHRFGDTDNFTTITNNPNSKLLSLLDAKLISNRPTSLEYEKVFGSPDNTLITLHGWNRIIPADICNRYNIYNVHPGDIVNYPFLKGADPQQVAFDFKMERSGVVIHKCSPEVDCGEIVSFRQTDIKGLNVDEITFKLRAISIEMWLVFLKEQFK